MSVAPRFSRLVRYALMLLALLVVLVAVAWVVAPPPESAPLPTPAALRAVAPGEAVRAVAAAPDAPWAVASVPFACQQTTCDAELWLPRGVQRPPVIVMAHGFGALRHWGLPPFAERFVRAGFAVYLFDYRGFGRSGGLPRNVVDGAAHVQDWLAAIDAIRQRPEVDGQRLGIWGTSFSGGSVLLAAAQRPDAVRAVSAQVPFVNGLQSTLRASTHDLLLATWYALHDVLRGPGETPLYAPIIARQGFAALNCPECWSGYGQLVPPGNEALNKVAARLFLTLPFYAPGRHASEVRAPVLLIAAERDGLIPIEGVRDVARRLPHAEYVELKGADHFSSYTGPLFDDVSRRQVIFFLKTLAH